MANIKSMEMAEAIFTYPYIQTRKSLFGLCTTVIYAPTQSRVKGYTLDYDMEMGRRVRRLMEGSPAEWKELIGKNGVPTPTKAMGNVLVEVCVSDDHLFAAVQVLQYTDLSYQPVGNPRICEGEEAKLLARLFSA